MKARRKKFKDYHQDQISLLPPSLDELIDENHSVRMIDQVIERIDLTKILSKYKGGGTSSYHPKMLLKVVIYCYLNNIISSRKIEAAVKDSLPLMWLSGMARPDHNTINRFITDRLNGVIKIIFKQVVLLLADQGMVDIKSVYTDGTKIEANANRYTFVWKKNTQRYKQNILNQLEELWEYTQKVAAEELQDNTPNSFDSLDPEQVQKTIDNIGKALKDKPVDKEIKSKLQKAKREWPQKLKKYQQQEKILGERSSYSKTDPDATFMRMKEDHLQNGQLKASYNAQISTNDQFVINYTIHQSATDTTTLKTHLETYEVLYNTLPNEITADAGYGSEENYDHLEKKQIEAYVKYNWFDKEQKKKKNSKKHKSEFHVDNLYYNEQQDCCYCPMGQRMELLETKQEKSKTGFVKTISYYQAQNCHGCPIRGVCHESKENRIVAVNHNLQRLKAKAREKLLSDEGVKRRKQRPVDVETVFGNIKQNKGLRRFSLRGLEKIDVELGLFLIAHNLSKMIALIGKSFSFEKLLSFFKLIFQRSQISESFLFLFLQQRKKAFYL